jgi:hypothetical protein
MKKTIRHMSQPVPDLLRFRGSRMRADPVRRRLGEWFSVEIQTIGAFRDLRGSGQRRAEYS